MLLVILAAIVGLLAILLLFTNTNVSGLPPSPFKVFFLGNTYMLRKNVPLYSILSAFTKPVLTFWMGSLPVVVINDYEVAKKVACSTAFSGRPQRYAGHVISRGFKGLIITDYSPELRKRRRIGAKAFQWHNMAHLESILKEESMFLTESLKTKTKESESNVITLSDEISKTACNILWRLLFNRRVNTKLGEFDTIMKMLHWLDTGLTCANMLEGFPMLKYFKFKDLLNLHKFKEARDKLMASEYSVHLKRFNGDNLKDFTDLLISENFEPDELEMMLSDFFSAGYETTSNALNFALIYLLNNTNIRKKCIEEIDRVLGTDGDMELKLIDQFHYIHAVVLESLRIRPIAPLGVPHRTCKTLKLLDYTIPKHTCVMINIYKINHDSKYHKNPEKFDPERFLDVNGKYKSIDGFFTFTTGTRECLGKRFAIKEMIFLLVTILKNFSIQVPYGVDVHDAPLACYTLSPKNYKVKINVRPKPVKS